MIKVLNLYAGIGGNRKLWKNVDVTAIEINPEIAKIYQDFFPEDKVIVGDAIDYLEKNFNNFDFIWASPPCKSHSRINRFNVARRYNGESTIKVNIPDFRLYSIINFLETYFRGDWVVENTYSDYKPLKKPQIIGRHFIWSGNIIPKFKDKIKSFHNVDKHSSIKELCKINDLSFDYFDKIKIKSIDKKQMIRNCVNPELGLHIFQMAFKDKQQTLETNTEVKGEDK